MNPVLPFGLGGVALALAGPALAALAPSTAWSHAGAHWLAVLGCCALITLYGATMWRRGADDPGLLAAAAEHAYLLGYLFTLAALVGVLLRPSLGANPSGNALLFAVGMKVTTSVWGLLTMLALQVRAQRLQPASTSALLERLDSAEANHAVAGLVDLVLEARKADLRELREVQQALVGAMKDLRDTVVPLHEAVGRFHVEVGRTADALKGTQQGVQELRDGAGGLARQLEQTGTTLRVFNRDVGDCHQVLDEFVALVEAKVEVAS